jgi:hypothetical protein
MNTTSRLDMLRRPQRPSTSKQPFKCKHFQGEIILQGLLSHECKLRQKKYLNNIIEQDHRFTKKLSG